MPRFDLKGNLDQVGNDPGRLAKALVLVIVDEFNARRANEAALAQDVFVQINALRTNAGLPALDPGDYTATQPQQVTIDQVVTTLKAKLRNPGG